MLSVIIVSYNSKAHLPGCLNSLHQALAGIEAEIIVVDNASADDSVALIREGFPEAQLIEAGTNLGFGRGCNLAAAKARGEYLLLLNPDTVLNEDTVRNLLYFAETQPKAGIWGGVVRLPDGPIDSNTCRRFPSLWGLFCLATGLFKALPENPLLGWETYADWDRTSVKCVDIVSGCFFLTTSEVWSSLDGFDQRYFLYSEEDDFCLRARQLGLSAMVTPTAELTHFLGSSMPNKAERMIMVLRGKVTYFKTHWSPTKLYMGKVLLLFWVLSRMFAYRFSKSWTSKLWQVAERSDWQQIWSRRKCWMSGYES
jgi:GT2 family glycosyltransferase